MMNQCDGCMAGKPLINGMHLMVQALGYKDYMVCQKSKYI